MLSYYPTSFNTTTGQLETNTFNTNDFENNYSSATVADLLDYANLYNQNIFSNTNYFANIFVNSINGVSSTVLSYLQDITEDVQSVLNTLTTSVNTITQQVTGIVYDSVNQVTEINNSVYANSFSTNNNASIAGNCAIAGTLAVTNISNQNLLSNNINCNTITCNQLNYNGIINPQQDIGCYLYVIVYILSQGQTQTTSVLCIPLNKSCFITNLNIVPTSPFTYMVTLRSGYTLSLIDRSNNIINSISNTTGDILYNASFTNAIAPYTIQLSFNGVILN